MPLIGQIVKYLNKFSSITSRHVKDIKIKMETAFRRDDDAGAITIIFYENELHPLVLVRMPQSK